MEDRLSRIVAHRRQLHRIPEVNYDLPMTQAYVLDALKKTGARLEALSPAGVLAYFDMGKKDTVALRADMDALPIQECSGLPFASGHPGKMHACGHDAHMAMLLSLAEELREMSCPRNVLLIFQPAEEPGNGARIVLESKALERYNAREIYACHVEPPLPSGTIGCRPGPLMAMSSEVHLQVKGKSTHIAQYSEGIDALMAGLTFLQRSRAHIESVYRDVRHLYGYGRFESGTANNIVAEKAEAWGTLRAYDEGIFEEMKKDVLSIAKDISAQSGAKLDLSFGDAYPPVLNDEACFEKLKAAAGDLPFQVLAQPKNIAEDFACYLKRLPGAMFLLGLGTPTPLHSSNFIFDESALPNGTEMFKRLVMAG